MTISRARAGMTPSAQQLRAWLGARRRPVVELEALAGDVSPRRYTRAHLGEGRTAIVAYYPEELRSSFARYLAATELLDRHGLPVPKIYECDAAVGLMLIEDVGTHSLYELELSWDERLPLLQAAADMTLQIGELPRAEVGALNPPLDQPLLRQELDQTWQHFLEPRGLVAEPDFNERLSACLDRLCSRLGAAPSAPCHRDFMARNLMLDRRGQRLVIIDHQDLRLGPAVYDLASLLNDSLFPPPGLCDRLLEFRLATGEERLGYHRAAAQRTLKIVGTFARFAALGSERYLELIPPALERAVAHLAALPESNELAGELRRRWSLAARSVSKSLTAAGPAWLGGKAKP